jgi:hypothetical protein
MALPVVISYILYWFTVPFASGRNPQDENVSVAEPERRVFAIKPSGDWLSNEIEGDSQTGRAGLRRKAYDLRAFHA